MSQGAPRVDGTAAGWSEPQSGASWGAWVQCGDELGEVRAFGCGEFGDIPVPQYLCVVGRDSQSRGIPTGRGAAGCVQRSDAGPPRMSPASGRCPQRALRYVGKTVGPNQFSNTRS